MNETERAMLDAAYANSIAAKYVWQSLLSHLSKTDRTAELAIFESLTEAKAALEKECTANSDDLRASALAIAIAQMDEVLGAIEARRSRYI
ncbi:MULTISPECIES: hypothetical protein [Acetobacter]|uniref:Uncharacterized protein n=1 Tax=Acetobacter lovaniensis TaxID=104100 RepID=A0A841QGR0_9PROT|nr:hypothetical protein [Acetobacter lovaniensis]MBB6457227.1 hypothetical protein [Acetobacter lovaniensis]NHN81195.1 hypothetical protein [Acetobacter lovaniensis]GBQ69387.1 hypothetical protein AA0474_1911 [Acetobacter lovaniensis NRIC 0474]